MKKALSLVLAALLIISLLPMAVMAEAPAEVKVKIYNGTAKDFTLTLANGDEVYLVAGEENKDLIKWTEAEAPADNFVSFAYAADTGVLKTIFKNKRYLPADSKKLLTIKTLTIHPDIPPDSRCSHKEPPPPGHQSQKPQEPDIYPDTLPYIP